MATIVELGLNDFALYAGSRMVARGSFQYVIDVRRGVMPGNRNIPHYSTYTRPI